MRVSENSGTPKSSILIGFSIINHPFWGTPIFGNTHMVVPWLRYNQSHAPYAAHVNICLKKPTRFPGIRRPTSCGIVGGFRR